MLPLLRNSLKIALYPTHVSITSKKRGWRTEWESPQVLECGAGMNASLWQAPLEALGEYFEENKPLPSEVEFVLPDSFVRYALIPWSDALQTEEEINAFARLQFESLFGNAAESWELKTDMSAFEEPGIGCAIDAALLAALNELCDSNNLRINAVKPAFMLSYNQWHRKIDNDALFGVVDSEQCVLSSLHQGAWHSIRSVRFINQIEVELPLAIDREILLQGLDNDVPIYLLASGAFDPSWISHRDNITLLQ